MVENKLKKEYFETLLEGIKGDVKLVLEGHAVLDKKIEDVKEMVREVDIKVDDIRKVVKKHATALAHVGA